MRHNLAVVLALLTFSISVFADEMAGNSGAARSTKKTPTTGCNWKNYEGIPNICICGNTPVLDVLQKNGPCTVPSDAKELKSITDAYKTLTNKSSTNNTTPDAGDRRVSSTGTIFIRDRSIPILGEAYKDPSGLIWGDIVMTQGHMDQFQADKYCKDNGARLPTKEEFQQLASYLGEGTANGYSPHSADGRTDVLPALSDHVFWSSSIYPVYSNSAYDFGRDSDGYVSFGIRSYTDYSFRCVVTARRRPSS